MPPGLGMVGGADNMSDRQCQISLIVVWFLGCLSVISLLGIILLGAFGRDTPASLIAIASTSVGALGSSLIVPSPAPIKPQPVTAQVPVGFDHQTEERG